MESPPLMPGHAPRWVRLAQLAVAVAVLAYCVSTLPGVRPRPGFDVWLDGWLQGTCYVLVAGVVVLRAVVTTTHVLLWRLLAGAVAARALGFVLALAWIQRMASPPYPSLADVCWVLSSLLLLAVLVRRVAEFTPRQSLLVLLDAVTGALVVAAFTVFALDRAVGTLTGDGTPSAAVAVNVVYPSLDVALLVAAATAVTLARSRLTRTDALVVVGIVGFAVVDVVYLVRLADGTWRPGSPLSGLSLVATLLISYSAWVPARRAVPPGPDPDHEPTLLATVLYTLACVAVLVADQFVDTPLAVVILTAAALLTAILRGAVTLAEDRTYSGRIIGATSEELLRFQSLVESSSDFIAIASPDQTMLYLNPGGRRLVGLPADTDVSTMRLQDFLLPQDRDTWTRVRHPTVLRHGSWEGQGVLAPQDGGEPVPVAVSTFVIPDPQTGRPSALATVQRDLRARLAAEASVRGLAEQRERLLSRLVQAQDEERSRIAVDVHDDSVQALAAVELRLGALQRRVAESAPQLLDTLDAVSATVEGATSRLRHLLFDLESPAREQALVPALREAAAFVLEDSDVRWRVVGEDREPVLPEATRVTAYRIAKEALINARRHSGGSCVVVEVWAEEGGLVVSVRDNGRGFPDGEPEDRPGHLGVAGMRDRAALAGGRLELRAAPGGGAEVWLWLPVATSAS